ncbi:glycosyltransferase family 39 protein [Fictibacillus nanhaiensis]|uniref:hypothetical protein n=1 Tax=Fictibacillus nanhaiensis TaxID=742169 RepID=UPI001FEB40A7|nr:hypothetical protein [Fictibacillus nanhaiensis]MBY6036809.1 glycosyltransferase family 39 protein [Fictibacillus nanhaiensis]
MGRANKLIAALVLLLLFITFYIRFLYSNTIPSSWDQVDFALALDRFDLLAMQPHFPGYPFFIFGGMIVHSVIDNPSLSLSVFNNLVAISATVPMYLLAKRYVSRMSALIITLVLQTSIYFMILVNQPMSEGAALGVLWWFLWSLLCGIDSSKLRYQLLPLMFFSILMGIRLSYLPFGFGLLFLWWFDYERNKDRVRLMGFIVLAFLFQLVWVVALIMTEGSLIGFIKLSMAFVTGHFTSWGGTVVDTQEPFSTRLHQLILYNIILVGMAAKSAIILIVLSSLTIWVIVKNKSMRVTPMLKNHRVWLTLISVYFFWNLYAQNIEKPRHSYPITFMILFLWLVLLIEKQRLMKWACIGLAVIQLWIGSLLLHEQATKAPSVHQVAEYLTQKNKDSIVYTWEETRVFQYLGVPFEHKRFYTYDLFLQDKSYHTNEDIYLTNHLIEGFEEQGIDVSSNLEKVRTFQSNDLFDPVYDKIVLYRWKEH